MVQHPDVRHRKKSKASRPPWDDMDAAKGWLDRWIECRCLPQTADFRFSEPGRMSPEDNFLLATWIVKGEMGMLKDDQVFRWINQGGTAPPPLPTVLGLCVTFCDVIWWAPDSCFVWKGWWNFSRYRNRGSPVVRSSWYETRLRT